MSDIMQNKFQKIPEPSATCFNNKFSDKSYYTDFSFI